MIFGLRLIIFSALVLLGLYISTRSIRLRKIVTAIYTFLLLWYTLLCRLPLFTSVPVAADSTITITPATELSFTDIYSATQGKTEKLSARVWIDSTQDGEAYAQTLLKRKLIMTKTPEQKALEKQTKQEKDIAQKTQRRQRAAQILGSAKYINGFRIMDPDSESVLKVALETYSGNDSNRVAVTNDSVPKHLGTLVTGTVKKMLQKYCTGFLM